MTATIAPLLGGLFLLLGIGMLLRARAGRGQADADTLNGLIIDVMMPALLVRVLSQRDVVWGTAAVLGPTTLALLVSGAVAFLVVKLVGGDKPTQGSAALTAAFCNTGFLGFPLLLALYPGDAVASSTALVVDTVDTTLLLWTAGLAFAQRMGHGGRFDAKDAAAVFLRPLTLAIVVGVGMRLGHVELPLFLANALDALGACVSALVFLSLGLSLDLRALTGRVLPVVAVATAKLLVAPVVCLLLVRALGLPEPMASVAVLQCAMPSAMVSVIVAAKGGCDRSFAAGVATLSTLACLLTLPFVGWLLDV